MCPGQEKGLNGSKFQTEKVKLTLAKAPVDDRQWMHLLSPIPPGCCLFNSLGLSLPLCNTTFSSQGALRPCDWLPACSNPEKCDL